MTAIAVMGVATFLPFLRTPCGDCLATPTDTLQVSTGLVQAQDAWVVLAILICLATTAALHVVGMRPALTALGCLGLSLIAVAFPFVEIGDNGARVFPGATAVNPMATEVGFYVFILGATIAAVASLILVLRSLPQTKRRAALQLKAPS
jgi:hypothetical protein